MRQLGRLSLELLFVALLYWAVGIVLNVFSPGWGRPLDVLQLLLSSFVVLIPLVFLIIKVKGTWWSVGGTCVLALAGLHVVVPRMELLLDRGASLLQLPWTALYALGAAGAGTAALLMILRSWQGRDPLPPYPWPAGEPRSYFWRIPAVLVGYALLHVAASRLGRAFFGQAGHPPFLDELVNKIAVGIIVVLVALAVSSHLGVRSFTRTGILLAVMAVLPAIGRWQILTGWPATFIATRVSLRFFADVCTALVCAGFMLASRDRLGGVIVSDVAGLAGASGAEQLGPEDALQELTDPSPDTDERLLEDVPGARE